MQSITLFYSYSHRDEALRDKLDEHLAVLKRRGLISAWHDRRIMAGAEWKGTIDDHVDDADVILLLVSPSFISSDYCWDDEMTRALQRHDRGEARVIPVILRPCLWQETPLAKLQVLPKDARPITQWQDPDEAFLDVASAVQHAVEDLRRNRPGRQEPPAASSAPPSHETRASARQRRVGVDPRALPDLEVFKDVDAAWCPEMIRIPAGDFFMGCADEHWSGLSPEPNLCRLHRVSVAYSLAVGRYPVTFEEYDQFCSATGHWPPKDEGWGRGRRPVINVTWKDAQAYAEWLASETGKPYRLPTEAEWEYACRAGTATKYAFGDSMSTSLARYGLTAWSTVEVGSYRPNLWGLFDVHGNVYEWVQDVWHEDYEGAPNDGSAWLDGGVEARRVARGGAYVAVESSLVQSGYRASFEYMASQNNLGFRLARAL